MRMAYDTQPGRCLPSCEQSSSATESVGMSDPLSGEGWDGVNLIVLRDLTSVTDWSVFI